MRSVAARLLKARRAWGVTIALLFAWAVSLQVGLRLRDRGNLRQLDPAAPYWIELGRGSGWRKLDTVKVHQDGTVVLHRVRFNFVETATLQLPAESLAEVLESVEETGVLGLYKEYHEPPGFADGRQWVLKVQQGRRKMSVYCDSYFPEPIVSFVQALDRILAGGGVEKAKWRILGDEDEWSHERELWDSIKR